VLDYLDGGKRTLLEEYVEVESGKRNDRPELEKALAACKRHWAKLVIAKLDRLSRNLAFIAKLMDRKVDFVCCDNTTASKFTVHILAAVAEHERDAISAPTKAALAAAKAKGRKLGNYRGIAAAKQRATAERAETVRPAIAETAHLAARAAAGELNRRGVKTANGKLWHSM
jgi:DNA invertase Pin-like site-specific DNA recombinase